MRRGRHGHTSRLRSPAQIGERCSLAAFVLLSFGARGYAGMAFLELADMRLNSALRSASWIIIFK
jgi:hypothetical protein